MICSGSFGNGFLTSNNTYCFKVEQTIGFAPNAIPTYSADCCFNTNASFVGLRMSSPISISPNPFSEFFNIKSDKLSLSDLPIFIRVFDKMGQEIEIINTNLKELETRNIGEKYPAGIYNVLIKQEEYSENFRLIKK